MYTEHEFDELCFEFGIELDDVVEEVDEKARSRGEVAGYYYYCYHY